MMLQFQYEIAFRRLSIYRAVKRYTTLGMATDQGKTSNLNDYNSFEIENKVVPAVGHTTFDRLILLFPGAIVGREVGKHSKPIRKSALLGMKKIMQFLLMQGLVKT